MKIRHGFVSNSSSSSFCILGIVLNEEQFEIAEDKIGWRHESLDHVYGIEEYYEDQLVGAHPNSMKNEETLLQFKERIAKELTKIGIETKAEDLKWHTDGGRDG